MSERQLASDKYILDAQGIPVAEPDLLTWAQWYETADRSLMETKCGAVRVSTVFMGLDHGFGSVEPILWETMVFGGPLDGEEERYSTREDALEGHERMYRRVRGVPWWRVALSRLRMLLDA